MATLDVASKANQAVTLPALLIVTYAKELDSKAQIDVNLEEVDAFDSVDRAYIRLTLGNQEPIYGPKQVIGKLVEHYPILNRKKEEGIKEWLQRTESFYPNDHKSVETPLLELDAHLTLRSYIAGYSLSLADVSVWGALRGNKVAHAAIKKASMINISRWFRFIEETNPWISSTVQSMNAQAQAKKSNKSAEGGSYDIALPDVASGVVTRFPPEPSGYLHIGHAKAALLNDYFAHEQYNGTLICRFDDTNPSKEKEEFQDAIVEDLALMGIRPDKTSYTSDYFDELYQCCVKLVSEGKAYCDDTDQETMRNERWHGKASKQRDSDVKENLARLEEMREGSAEGVRWCVRAKISIDDPNKAMRDPVIYRCNLERHHRTGNKWKVYPTYDFCCPIVDSMEGVTHALRTIEYRDRNPQYEWMLSAMNLRKVHIWDFARMNFIRTFLSKRKLTKLVDEGMVWGWDDPRFPTIRGIRRRGMTIDALREFILKQGPSRNIVNLDWTIFWATNKKYIDPVAPRHTAISQDHCVTATIKGARPAPHVEEKPKHGKNPELGSKKVAYSAEIIIEQVDAQNFAQDEEITLMNWGNAIVRSITHSVNPLSRSIVTSLELDLNLQGDVKTTKQKITWLSTKGQELIPVELVDFDYLITKDIIEKEDDVDQYLNPHTEFRTNAHADGNVVDLKENDIIQFERKGYFRVDRRFQHGKPAVLFNIPTGKTGK